MEELESKTNGRGKKRGRVSDDVVVVRKKARVEKEKEVKPMPKPKVERKTLNGGPRKEWYWSDERIKMFKFNWSM